MAHINFPSMRVVKAWQIASTDSNASQALDGIAKKVSIRAKTADLRFNFGAAASSSTFFIGKDERLFLDIPYKGCTLQTLRDASTSGHLEVIEYD